jgi:hypothetical protein
MMSDDTQLELFKGWFSSNTTESRTIELLEAVPKYIFDKHAKASSQVTVIRRSFTHRNVSYQLRIAPAIIDRNGKPIAVFPGEREEIIFRATLHLATQQQAALKTGMDKNGNLVIGAGFTLKQLEKHLRSINHGFPLAEIDEAIRVCRLASYDIKTTSGKKTAIMSAGLFLLYSAVDDEADLTGEQSFRYIVFNPLVTKSIVERTFRSINYERLMRISSPLARWLYDRISHNYRQAEKDAPLTGKGYHISSETILEESGIAREKRFRDNLKTIRSALEELKEKGVLSSFRPWTEILTYGEKPNRGPSPIIKGVWTLYLSNGLIEEIFKGHPVEA